MNGISSLADSKVTQDVGQFIVWDCLLHWRMSRVSQPRLLNIIVPRAADNPTHLQKTITECTATLENLSRSSFLKRPAGGNRTQEMRTLGRGGACVGVCVRVRVRVPVCVS